ncbi:hypothetical protein, partial [Saccharopolyspora erythraea]|uniref:WXG100-like domain-containing protein n=1 Tax=Saccharopolyspora erythraea TaxID=1836 RepID=UPI0012FBE7A5
MTDADEGVLFAVAELLEAGAVGVAEVGPVLRELVGRVRSEFSGKAADRFAERLEGFVPLLERGGAALSGVGEKTRELALQVQYLKLMTVYGLNLLLAEMAVGRL